MGFSENCLKSPSKETCKAAEMPVNETHDMCKLASQANKEKIFLEKGLFFVV
jgi:hypothetical protein